MENAPREATKNTKRCAMGTGTSQHQVDEAAGPTQPLLGLTYKGSFIGRYGNELPPAVLLAGQPALEPALAEALLASLGLDLNEAVLVKKSDLENFSVTLENPVHAGEVYKPFFFDRQDEYGKGHAYWESLVHTADYEPLLKQPATDAQEGDEEKVKDNEKAEEAVVGSPLFIKTASARFTNRTAEASIETLLPPASLAICAFVDALREVNHEFLEELQKCLLEDGEGLLPEALVKRFVDGVWRNIAVQYHFSGASRSTEQTLHLDHVNSALHMAVTLHGQRAVAFARPSASEAETSLGFSLLELAMNKGDVYLTSPTAILHGISVGQRSKEDRSVALQLRTLLSVEDANQLAYGKQGQLRCLLGSVLKTLDRCQTLVRVPTLQEWDDCRQKRLEVLRRHSEEEGASSSSNGHTVVFRNYFRTPTSSSASSSSYE
ncbi:hypothetical protein QOT17_002968 [Balamuthia mandrillaris]